jgi:hypothetical protein
MTSATRWSLKARLAGPDAGSRPCTLAPPCRDPEPASAPGPAARMPPPAAAADDGPIRAWMLTDAAARPPAMALPRRVPRLTPPGAAALPSGPICPPARTSCRPSPPDVVLVADAGLRVVGCVPALAGERGRPALLVPHSSATKGTPPVVPSGAAFDISSNCCAASRRSISRLPSEGHPSRDIVSTSMAAACP